MKARSFPDRNLDQIDVTALQEGIRITFRLKYPNTRVFHFRQSGPDAIVLDFQGTGKPAVRAKPESDRKKTNKKKSRKKTSKRGSKELTESEIRELVKEDAERKINQGWDEYKQALSLYQQGLQEESLQAFGEYEEKFPESPLFLGPRK